MSYTKSVLVLLFAAVLCLETTLAFCPLCENPGDVPKRFSYLVQDGRSCKDVYVGLAKINRGDPLCQATKDYAQEPCCSDEEPEPLFAPPPTTSPVNNGPVGVEPVCRICGTAEYPGIPGAIIVARYIGSYSCDQLFTRGLNGYIPGYLCGPVTDFAKPVCGCGEFNPRCQGDPAKCFGAPTIAPANQPTPQPVQPTAQPVQPTPQPVQPTPQPVQPTAQPVQPTPQPVQPTAQPVQPTPQPVTQPTSKPVLAQPTVFNRKTPPDGGKYANKLSASRGGAAAVLRGSRMLEDSLPEDDFEFHTIPSGDILPEDDWDFEFHAIPASDEM